MDRFQQGGVVEVGQDLLLDAVVGAVGVEHVRGAHLEAEAAGLEVVGHQVAGDGDEPGADVPPLPGERVDAPEGPQEGLRRQVLRQRL
jgi:hypothetical protein